jgi:hypothetical protein
MKRILFTVLIAALILSACASNASPTEAPAPEEFTYSRRAVELAPGVGGGGASDSAEYYETQAQTANGGQAVAIERLVIQNADVAIVVSDVDVRMKDIQALAEKLGGYVVSSQMYQTQVYNTNRYVDVPQASVSIRVPSEKLDEALDAIKADVVEIQSESRSGQDVTAEYVDLKSRLKNLEATEAQLTKIMQDAANTEDVLNVFNQLTAIREQIELVKGQMKYYEESAAMSAINITIIAEETIKPLEIGGWEPKGVALEAIQDLIDFLKGFADFFIRFFLRDLWVLLLIALPFYLVFLGARALFRKLRKPKVKPELTEEPRK